MSNGNIGKSLRPYIGFFRLRFSAGLQYRTAAWAGMATQFAWGFMRILTFSAFYAFGGNIPMPMQQLCSYIWMQQALLAALNSWFWSGETISMITEGNICFEMVRPLSIYNIWFIRDAGERCARCVLRAAPLIIFAAFLPAPYGLTINSVESLLLFMPSVLLGVTVVVSYNMIVYVCTFYTMSPIGTRLISLTLGDLFSGGLLPLSFFPAAMQPILRLLPFASMQDTPYMIWNGALSGNAALYAVGVQVAWCVILITSGRLLMSNTLKKVVVQGG